MDEEPFLLYPSSRSFLDGDASGIEQRFRFRFDALDFLAVAGIVAGLLVVLVYAVSLLKGGGDVQAPVAGGAIALVGFFFVVSRYNAASARRRLIRDGKVLPGVLISCTARDDLETDFGAVTRSYLVAVEYRFTTPAADERVEHAEQDRPDLRRTELPLPGTVVRVLYLDEQTLALL